MHKFLLQPHFLASEEMIQIREKYQQYYKEFKETKPMLKKLKVRIGGLHIIGTERHESRRIDNPVAWSAARQGDPGSTVFFFLSLRR